MTKFRKKPVVIEAMQFPGIKLGNIDDAVEFDDWLVKTECPCSYLGGHLHIKTLEDGPNGEAKHVASPGDWIVRGIKGEFYAVKPEIFALTYEPA